MDIFKCIETRTSVRKFTYEPVGMDQIKKLLDLAVRAATGSNAQPWGFVVIQGEEKIKAISDATKKYLRANLANIPELQQYSDVINSDDYCIFSNARTVLAVYGDKASAWHVYDGTLATANIMLGAHGMGLGTCWIGFAQQSMNMPEFKKEHGVPDNYELVCAMTLGYPAKVNEPRSRREPVIFNAAS